MASRGRYRTDDFFGLSRKDHPGILPFLHSKPVSLLFLVFPRPRWSDIFNKSCLGLLHLIPLTRPSPLKQEVLEKPSPAAFSNVIIQSHLPRQIILGRGQGNADWKRFPGGPVSIHQSQVLAPIQPVPSLSLSLSGVCLPRGMSESWDPMPRVAPELPWGGRGYCGTRREVFPSYFRVRANSLAQDCVMSCAGEHPMSRVQHCN